MSEYLGISGLFSNILTLLSLTDMGIGTVLIYSMYEPLANKNEQKLKELMNQYDTYMYKANCCFNQSNNNCNHTGNCNNSCNCNCSYNSNKCGYNNRPLIYCKKTGHYGN